MELTTMPLSSWPALLLLLFLGATWLFVHSMSNGTEKSKRRLPPGPQQLPIIGNLHQLGEFPYRSLHRLSQTYGPIMRLRLGSVPTVVVSSPAAARAFLKDHDTAFADRPHLATSDYLAYESQALAIAPYGPYWRGVRKLVTSELLSGQKVDYFGPARKEELAGLVAALQSAAEASEAVDVSAKLTYLTFALARRMVLGSEGLEAKEIDEVAWVIWEGSRLLAVFNIADYIPFAKVLDLQGLTKQTRKVKEGSDRFLDKIIGRRMAAGERARSHGDFVDVLLSFLEARRPGYEDFRFSSTSVKALTLELMASMIAPIVTVTDWAFVELIRHPETMKKVRAELDDVVGLGRAVEEPDLPHLTYLDMVIKESMRLHTPLPILVPQRAAADCVVSGYDVEKGTTLIVNAWAIAHDPEVWPEPEEFRPERFVESKVDVKGHDFELIPFGAGRRGCPGIQLGQRMVKLVLAQLVHCFEWRLPGGMSPEELDMKEVFEIAAPRAKHLVAIPTYRLHA